MLVLNVFSSVPSEILFHIFKELPPKDLCKAAIVCKKWNEIVRKLCTDDILFSKHCEKDFKNIFEMVKYKSHVLTNFEIYKSLSLWPKVLSAKELISEFAVSKGPLDYILGFVVLKNGILGVHKWNEISYYDLTTTKLIERCKVSGKYIDYFENDDIFIVLGVNHTLYVTVNKCGYFEAYTNVKCFLYHNKKVYFVSLQNLIYVYDMETVNHLKLIHSCEMTVLGISFVDQLYVLTCNQKILSYHNNHMVEVESSLGEYPFSILHKYQFLGRINWVNCLQWYDLNNQFIKSHWKYVTIVCIYGSLAFFGDKFGTLRLYFMKEGFNLSNAIHLKTWVVGQGNYCPLIKLDIIEVENGHKILVGLEKKIMVIELIH